MWQDDRVICGSETESRQRDYRCQGCVDWSKAARAGLLFTVTSRVTSPTPLNLRASALKRVKRQRGSMEKSIVSLVNVVAK